MNCFVALHGVLKESTFHCSDALMAKSKTSYVCTECGASQSKWQGQCPECGAWNALTEVCHTATAKEPWTTSGGYAGVPIGVIQKLMDIVAEEKPRIQTSIEEINRVFGGGLVPGSVVLMGGHPGAGKSTLLLQLVSDLAQKMSCLYVTGEESLQQVAMRAARMGVKAAALNLMAETQIESVLKAATELKPRVLVVDSIQVMQLEGIGSAPGSVSQVRESAALLTRFAKQTDTVVLLVGHVTKEGMLAGPKVLEHIIDCSLLLESTQNQRFRILRSQKNRFGAVNEMGVFAMLEGGLKEVKNPSALFISKSTEPAPGSVVTVVWEGTRPLLVEVQALVDQNQGGYAARVSVGTDQNRLSMLLAILHKQAGLLLSDQDVFINLVGGVKALETSVDLALVLAMVSSFRDKIIPKEWMVMGELGLTGEIRPTPNGQERILEAYKHGYRYAVVPKANLSGFKAPEAMVVKGVERLTEALGCLF